MAAADLTLPLLAAPFVAALLAPAVRHLSGGAAAWILALVPALLFLHFLALAPTVAGGQAILSGAPWAPAIGVSLSIRVDGLSLLFSLLITGIGALITVYAGAYLDVHPHSGRFFGFLFAFMGSMLGLVLADDFLTLFVFWEGTSLTSFLLIGFDHTRQAARRAALQALVVTGMGGLFLLAGLLLVSVSTGAASMSAALAAGDAVRLNAAYPAILAFVLVGAFTKSAQVPFHVWLPNAMEAPTPVSAYLHSATMVKAGVYLLMRTAPFLGGTPAWEIALPLFGGLTLLTGAALALRQTDLKLMLAYTTVASLGLLVLLVGAGTLDAATGAVAYLLAHALFKGALFTVAGGIDHGAGTRDIRRLGGLAPSMPITFTAAALAAWSMGGLPLTLGFFAKETLYEALLHDAGTVALLLVAVIGNAMLFAVACAVALRPFLGRLPVAIRHPHEGMPGLWLGPLMLAVLGAGLLLLPGWTGRNLVDPAVVAIAGAAPTLHVSPAIHFGVPLLVSVVTMAIGVGLFLALDGIRFALSYGLARIGWGPDRGFDQAIDVLSSASRALTSLWQTGRLERYITTTFAVVAAALLLAMSVFGEWPSTPFRPLLLPHEWAVVAVAVIGLVAVIGARDRLVAIVSLGIQGFAVALLFMLFGAPDLSFTQFMVETLSVVILALVMTRLKLSPSDARAGWDRARDGGIAVACGIGFGGLLAAVTAAPFDNRLSDFFGAWSRAVAHGRNVVNVVIVDFRGLDTLGEITVVMATGLAILALLRVSGRRTDDAGEDEDAPEDTPEVVR